MWCCVMTVLLFFSPERLTSTYIYALAVLALCESLCLCLYTSVKGCSVTLVRLSHSSVLYMWRSDVTAALAVVGTLFERHTTKQCLFVWCSVRCVLRLLSLVVGAAGKQAKKISLQGTDQGDTPKKGRKKKGEKKPIPEMKLTVDVQQWLRQKNGKAVKVKIADLRVDKTKERGQIRSINYDDVARKVTGYQALPPAGPLRVTAWEDSGMTRFAFNRRRFFSLLRYMVCFADGSLYVLNGQHGTETCRKIQELRLAEGKELEDWQEFCYVDILEYETPWGSGPRLQDCNRLAASL